MKRPITLEQHKKTKKEIENMSVRVLSVNERALNRLSDILGSSWTVYLFTLIAIVALTQVRTLMELIQWFSQTLVQFVALAIIQGHSNLQSKKDERRTKMMVKIFAENERDIHHLLRHQDYQNQQIDRLLKEIKSIKVVAKSKPSDKIESKEEPKESSEN
jgi:hypothetical protein